MIYTIYDICNYVRATLGMSGVDAPLAVSSASKLQVNQRWWTFANSIDRILNGPVQCGRAEGRQNALLPAHIVDARMAKDARTKERGAVHLE